MGQRTFERNPLLVFWEMTRACPLACAHCRANALPRPLPGQLSTEEGRRLIDSIVLFGAPPPIVVLTGGDVLARPDLFVLLGYAIDRGLRVTLAPAVSDDLTPPVLRRFAHLGVRTISLSMDGDGPVHDRIRGVPGHARRTRAAIRAAHRAGLRVQVNTAVMRENVDDLPAIANRLFRLGVGIWEIFFLVRTGRAAEVGDLAPADCESCAHFLYDAAARGLEVRTVEAPFFRRVVLERERGFPPPSTPLYRELTRGIGGLPAARARTPRSAGTRDGNGILFIAHDGTVHPGGFLPIPCGNVRTDPLVDVYRNHPLFRLLRDPQNFEGRCGACEHRSLCGGSRARAYAAFGDPLQEDPACPYVPRTLTWPAAAAVGREPTQGG